MLAFLASLGARLLPVRAFLGKIPPKVWLALGIALCLVLGAIWHGHKVKAYGKAQYAAGEQAAYANIAKQAGELKAKADALNATLAAKIRSRTDEALADNARAADALRLRGPGAARCAPIPRLPSAAGGHGQAPALADAAGPQVPADDRAAVPWGWLIDRSEEHDALLIENKAWRDWYATFNARWQAWQKDAEKASSPPNASAAPQ